jgi:hypothetical protein
VIQLQRCVLSGFATQDHKLPQTVDPYSWLKYDLFQENRLGYAGENNLIGGVAFIPSPWMDGLLVVK